MPRAMVTGNDGLFTLEVSPGKQSILISLDGYTSVERKVEVAANTSATLLDARLTPLDSRLNQISGLIGGHATNAHGDIKVVFAEDSSNSDIGIRITKVSQQGLRSPLPLGWSPVITVDLAANIQRLKHPATLTVPLPSNFRNIGPLTAVRWDNESSAWRAISEPIQIGDIPKIELSIDQLGQFSLMVQDQGTTQPPTAKKGNILEGAAPVAYPAGITGEGVVVPAAIMAGEESHARASASLTLSQALPSGTVFEAKVMETFTLTSNERLISQPFVQDLHFYAWPDDGNPLTLSVEFPVSPSKRFSIGELYMGKVDLFIRQPQATSAHLVGPAGAKITTKEGLDISIPSGCVARNTTLHLIPIPETLFAGHIPTGMTYLGGFSIDLGGVPLSKPIEVTLPPLSDSIILPPEPYIIMARVEEFGDIPSLFLTGLGQIINNRVQSLRASAGLTFSGIDKAGQYGFFLLADPVGFLQGTVYELSGQASTNAVISNASLPFLARVDKVGHHIQIGTVGNVQLLAENPDTSDQGMATALVTGEKEIVNLDISILQTPPRVVSVMPSDGSSGVPVTTTVSVTFSEPVTGINEDTFQLKDTSGNKVAGHLSLTDEGKAVTFYPGVSLSSESAYTLYLGDGIKDKAGYSLPGFSPVTFTTEDLSPPVSQGKLSISMPDKNGYATVTGTPGTAEPNSTVYIINNTSGMVVTISIPSSSVGSFSEKILADISDEIIVTIVDASGNSTTLNPGPFKDETTGAMAIGPKGGIVRGEGGIELDIPAGALPYATVVTVEPVDEPFELPEDIQGDPDLVDAFEENYEFVQAVRIDTGGVKFNYGVDLSVLAPPTVNVDDTFIVVQDEEIELGGECYDCDNDELIKYESKKVRHFKVADIATVKEVEGKMRITTASPPFPGILAQGIIRFFTPKVAIGVVRGKVVRKVKDGSGKVTGVYPVKGAVVRLLGSQVVPVYFTETKENGEFVISAVTTMGLYEQRQITLLVTDPLSAITQQRRVPVSLVNGPFAQTYPGWNIIVAAILEEDFVLESEEKIRADTTPPTINITFRADTLVDAIMEEGDELHIDINIKDNRAQNPIIEKIIINDQPTFVGVPNSYQYTIPSQNIRSGI